MLVRNLRLGSSPGMVMERTLFEKEILIPSYALTMEQAKETIDDFPAPFGRGAVQRCLFRRQGGAGAGRRAQVRRQRSAALAGAVVVRAEGRGHPADPARPRCEEHPPRTEPPGLRVPRHPQSAGRKLGHQAHFHP